MYISWVAAFITMIPMIPLVLNAWIPGDILGPWGVKMTTYLAIVVALVMMAYSALAMRQVVHWMAEIRDENYSNPNDFPMKYAKRVWLAPLFYTNPANWLTKKNWQEAKKQL